MKHLYDEVLRQFPEIVDYTKPGDEDLPYLVVGYIVQWLLASETALLDPDTVDRVVAFDRWCLAQPPGQSAADDIMSIEAVALREKLFEHDQLLPLARKMMSREELLLNKDHLASRIGRERLQVVLRMFR